MEEEIFVDNRIIEDQITKKYHQVKKIMLTKLNNAFRYKSIDLRPRESKIMLEILRFHPKFKEKWTKGSKFVYTTGVNNSGTTYYDIFIKPLQGELINFRKPKCIEGLQKLQKNFETLKKDPLLQTELQEFKKNFEEQVNIRKDFGICTKCFGCDDTYTKIIFCDCLLKRTSYTEFSCTNPLENHTVIEGELFKSIHGTYNVGYEEEDLIQNVNARFVKTEREITKRGKHNIKKGTILYQLNDRQYILVGEEDKMDSFKRNIHKRINDANENSIITLDRENRFLKQYDEE